LFDRFCLTVNIKLGNLVQRHIWIETYVDTVVGINHVSHEFQILRVCSWWRSRAVGGNKLQLSGTSFFHTGQGACIERVNLAEHGQDLCKVLVAKIEVARSAIWVIWVVLEKVIGHELNAASNCISVFLWLILLIDYPLCAGTSQVLDHFETGPALQLKDVLDFGDETHFIRKVNTVQNLDSKCLVQRTVDRVSYWQQLLSLQMTS
jgi:hypothetical protein